VLAHGRRRSPVALYCGIDLHSNNNWLVVLDGPEKVVKDLKLPNDLSRVIGELEPFRDELEGVAVESTFNWYWLVDGLMDAGFPVRLVNTSAVKQYEGLKYTNDRHDARWLAHLQALGILPEGYIYPKGDRPVRDLLRRRGFLVEKRTSVILAMQGAYGCWTGERVSVNDIKRWTNEDVDTQIEDELAALSITCLLEPMSVLTEQIKRLEKEALSCARRRPEHERLKTVWGIGRVLSLAIMYEVGDISRFPEVGNFSSYCRLVKSGRFSNGKKKGSGNAKNGNPYLSWAFSEAAHFAVRHHPEAKRYVQRKAANTNGMVAIRALAHKLARATYYVLRDEVDFDPTKLFR
jgi:transposase